MTLGMSQEISKKSVVGWYIDLNEEDLLNSRHHLAVETQMNDLRLKTRVDSALGVDLFADMKLSKDI